MSIHQSTQALLLLYTHLLPHGQSFSRGRREPVGYGEMGHSRHHKFKHMRVVVGSQASIHGNTVQSTKTTQQATPSALLKACLLRLPPPLLHPVAWPEIMKHTALAYRICDLRGVKTNAPRAEAQTAADVFGDLLANVQI